MSSSSDSDVDENEYGDDSEDDISQHGTAKFSQFPLEIRLMILHQMDPNDLLSFSQCNRYYYNLIAENRTILPKASMDLRATKGDSYVFSLYLSNSLSHYIRFDFSQNNICHTAALHDLPNACCFPLKEVVEGTNISSNSIQTVVEIRNISEALRSLLKFLCIRINVETFYLESIDREYLNEILQALEMMKCRTERLCYKGTDAATVIPEICKIIDPNYVVIPSIRETHNPNLLNSLLEDMEIRNVCCFDNYLITGKAFRIWIEKWMNSICCELNMELGLEGDVNTELLLQKFPFRRSISKSFHEQFSLQRPGDNRELILTKKLVQNQTVFYLKDQRSHG